MAVSERVSEATFLRLALNDPDQKVELHDGRLVEKPGMGVEHSVLKSKLSFLLQPQLDPDVYRVRVEGGMLRHPAGSYYLPDLAVIPVELDAPLWDDPDRLDVYDAPLPLVVEIWSRTTGAYDRQVKVRDYQRRGDEEIWRVHPRERTVIALRRQADGTYAETVYREGIVPVASLPGVAIDLAELFRRPGEKPA